MIEVGKKYNKRTLYRMRQFYNIFSNEKVSPLVSQLSWTHYLVLISLKDYNEINYYVKQVINRKLSKRELQEIIKNKEYERLPYVTKNKIINNEKESLIDFIKEPIIIKNNINNNNISEKILQKLILENIEDFMNELGNGHAFIGSEYKIKLGDRYNYIDLLLYNLKYRCYVVVELKAGELKKEYIGQIEIYMNYIDENIRTMMDNKTIGIIICKENNKYVIKYCSDKRIISRTYEFA